MGDEVSGKEGWSEWKGGMEQGEKGGVEGSIKSDGWSGGMGKEH